MIFLTLIVTNGQLQAACTDYNNDNQCSADPTCAWYDNGGNDKGCIDAVAENNVPTFTSSPNQSAEVGVLYEYTPTAEDVDEGDTYTITAPSLPEWLSWNGSKLSGTPASTDIPLTNQVQLTVTDNHEGSSNQLFIIDIAAGNIARTDLVEEPGQCGIFPSVLTTYDHLYASGNNDQACNTENISYPLGEITGSLECFASIDCGSDSYGDCLREDPPGERYGHDFPANSLSGTPNSPLALTNLTELEYGDIVYPDNNGGQTINFAPLTSYSNTSQKIMLLGNLNVNGGYTLSFEPGDYYFDSITISGNNNAIVLPNGGPVRIFIKGDYNVKMNNLATNTAYANDPGDLFIYVNGNLTDTSDGGGTANLSAYMYIEGDVTLNNNSSNWEIRGGITAEGSITINGNNPSFINVGDPTDLGLGDCTCVTVGFEYPSYSISENINIIGSEDFIETRIILDRAVPYDVTVVYNTEDGDPSIGNPARVNDGDYRRQVNQLITIPAGNTNVSLPIGIFNDAPIEVDEHFYVQLSDPQPSSTICLNDINRTKINILAQYDAPVCFEDHFDNGLDSKWRVLRSIGTFTPEIITAVNGDNRLRLTDKTNNQATTITKDYEFNTSQNLIIVEFDYYAYGGCGDQGGIGTYGADGIVNTLFDSVVGDSPTPGGRGGSMGYAQITTSQPGFEGGWLGLGIDEYGNFGNCNEGRIGGLPGTSCDSNNGFNPQSYTNTAVIRGDGSGFTGYEYLEGVLLNTIPGQTPVAAKRSDGLNDYSSGIYRMTIDARDAAHLYIRLERDLKDGNGYTVIIDQFDAKEAQYNQGVTPEKVRYAISSGTGGGCNNHELNWIRVKGNCGIYGQAPSTGPFDAWDTFRDNASVVPVDKNISTKIVEKDFQLILASLDETLTGYETKVGAGSNISVAIYKPGTLTPISNSVNFDANTSAHITSDMFTLPQAHEEAVVGFRLCATVETPQSGTGYVYRLWPTSNCTGQINDCNATTTGNPTWHICYSTDNFAVRPKNFTISPLPSTIIAGKGYALDYTAKDFKDQATIGYTRLQGGSFDITTALEPAMPGCLNPTIDMNSSVKFIDGFHDGDNNATYFNTIGDFNLTLHEIPGSEFANVDADDTPFPSNGSRLSEALEITPYVINGLDKLHIVPFGYTLANVLKNAHDDGANSFTYLNDISGAGIKSMAGKLSLSIQAIIADDTSAENYETDCYANDTTLKIDYNLSSITPSGSLTELQYYIPDPLTAGQDALTVPINVPIQGTLVIPLAETIFKDGDTGSTDLNISLNFDRDINEVVNPFDLDIGDINLTDDSSPATSSKVNNTDRNITYLFARAKASKYFYEDITTTAINTPITINVYCDFGFTACDALPNIDTTSGGVNELDWWLAIDHNMSSNDGNVTLVKGAILEGTAGSSWTVLPTNVNISANGIDNNIVVSNTSGVTPLTVAIELDRTLPSSTNSWLIYNKFDSILIPSPFYKVRFIGQSGWAGEGQTGHVVDLNASYKKSKRVDW